MAELSVPADQTSGTASPAESRPRARWLATLRWVVGHALTQLAVALVLIGTSVAELSETFVEDLHSGRLRASHGLLVVGVWQVLQAIPNLVEGLERYLEESGGRDG